MARRSLLSLGLLLTLITCRDGFEPHPLARIAVAPVLPSKAALGDFGLTIDHVRFVVVRPVSDTLADTTLVLPLGATELALELRVPLVASPETLNVSIVALSGTIPLFTGTRPVRVPTPPPPPEIPVTTYIGPAADSVVILPRSPFILLNDSLRLQAHAFNGGVPVTQFFVSWSARRGRLGCGWGPGALPGAHRRWQRDGLRRRDGWRRARAHDRDLGRAARRPDVRGGRSGTER